MRIIDQQYQEQAIRTQHRERHEAQRNAERDAKPDHIPTEDEMALHAPSTFHDRSDERRYSTVTPRENKTGARMHHQQHYDQPGLRMGVTREGDKAVGQPRATPIEYNPSSLRSYRREIHGNRIVAGKEIKN